jgi:long-chain acyl-CoA synthetase
MTSNASNDSSPAARDCLFLTGATGLLGRALLPRLRAQAPHRPVVVLVRQPEQAAEFERLGVRALMGDLSRPQMGLHPERWDELGASVTGIIHAAADVRFDLPLAEARAVNVFGVRQVLDLAAACPALKKLVHVSSVYVNGYRQGVFPEAPVPPGQRFINTYQQSKHEAEQLVLQAMPEIPAAIYRLSLVMADSAEGTVSQFNYFHHLLRYLPDSPLPVVPGDPRVRVDLIPNDWAAAALAYLFEYRFSPGSIRHLCAGPEASIPLPEAIERTCRAVGQRQGRPVRVPKLVSIGDYNRFLADCRDGVLRKAAKLVGANVRILGVRQTHLNPLATADLSGTGVVLPDVRDCLEKTVNFCLDTDWGRRRTERTAIASR